MYTFILIIHIIVVIFLIAVILIQQGRGGGLIETFAGAESMLGTKTSSFLVRATAVLACIFFLTSLSLAWLSKRETKSIVERIPNVPRKMPLSAGGHAIPKGVGTSAEKRPLESRPSKELQQRELKSVTGKVPQEKPSKTSFPSEGE